MWMFYAIFIFALVLTVTFHAAEHQESTVRKNLMKAVSFVLTAGVFGALYLTAYLFSKYADWNVHNAGLAVISLPIVGAAYYALTALLIKLSLPGKISTLNDDRRPAFICWAIAAVGSLLLPASNVTVSMNKTSGSGDTEFISHSKFVSVFKLIGLTGDFNDNTANFYRIFIILTFIVIPLLCLAVNFIIPSRLYIWANICGMTAHCVALALTSYLISDKSRFGVFVTSETMAADPLKNKISDSQDSGYAIYDAVLRSGPSTFIPLAALIFLSAYLAVTTFYYIYTQRKISYSEKAEHQPSAV